MPEKVKLILCPITLKEATEFVKRHHRHHKPPVGAMFSIGIARDGEEEPCGVAMIGRPVSRMLQDGWTAEVTRVCTDGTKNACSKLLGAAWRACRAMGYRRLITYTLPHEGGKSIKGAGWRLVGKTRGGEWSRESRPRLDLHPTQMKLKWERTSDG